VRPQLLHLDGPRRGRTITYDKTDLMFGSSQAADVRYTEGLTVQARHAELKLIGDEFHLRALEGEVFVNEREVEEVILDNNDLIEIGRHGPKMRFRIYAGKGRALKPVAQMVRDAREVGQASGVFALTQSMFDDLKSHASPRLKIGGPVILLAILGLGVAYFGGWVGGRQGAPDHAEQEKTLARIQAQYAREISRLQSEVDRLRARNVSRDDLAKVRSALVRNTRVVDDLLKRDTALKQVLDVYSGGVCMVHGVWMLYTNRNGKIYPLRNSKKKPLQIEYVGSGFLASKQGHVITNRHVAEPWWHNSKVSTLMEQGFEPTFVRLEVIFPGRAPLPVDISTIKVSPEGMDVATFMVKKTTGIPVLPLAKGDIGGHRGHKIILLGYPTGMKALLARADPEVVGKILKGSPDVSSLIHEFAKRKLISPIITQGALNEVKEKRLVYDADTTSGGSGGPVFALDGTVIGVNFAITRDFGGSNFGVPIRFARTLLENPG